MSDFDAWFASEHPETNALADAQDWAAIGNRYAARTAWNAAIALMRGQSEVVSGGKVRPTLDMSGRLHFDVAAAVRNGQFADEIEGARMLGKKLRKPITKGLLQRARDLFEDSRTFARERGDKAHATQCTKDMNAIDAVLLPAPTKDTADEQ